jgi:hypothetical protein
LVRFRETTQKDTAIFCYYCCHIAVGGDSLLNLITFFFFVCLLDLFYFDIERTNHSNVGGFWVSVENVTGGWRICDEKWEWEWEMRNEKWEMRNENWEMRNEKWEMRNEKWEMRNEKWEMRNEKWEQKIFLKEKYNIK